MRSRKLLPFVLLAAAVMVSLNARAEPRRRAPPSPPKPAPPGPAPGPVGQTVHPVKGKWTLVSRFSPPAHMGVDLGAAAGTPLLACVDGTVRYGVDPKGGNVAILSSTLDGTAFYYAHMNAPQSGSRDVRAGEIVGAVGNSGNASVTAPHLHFELWPGGDRTRAVDPLPFLQTAKKVA